MAFELMEQTVIGVCIDCVYFNAYGRLDDTTMSADPRAADKHRAAIARSGWPWGTKFTSGCGRDCEEHGIAAFDGDEEAYEARDDEREPWFSWSGCEQCGSPLGGDREHATAWTYRADIDIEIKNR